MKFKKKTCVFRFKRDFYVLNMFNIIKGFVFVFGVLNYFNILFNINQNQWIKLKFDGNRLKFGIKL